VLCKIVPSISTQHIRWRDEEWNVNKHEWREPLFAVKCLSSAIFLMFYAFIVSNGVCFHSWELRLMNVDLFKMTVISVNTAVALIRSAPLMSTKWMVPAALLMGWANEQNLSQSDNKIHHVIMFCQFHIRMTLTDAKQSLKQCAV
jgi:hypothetical protein